MRTSTKKASKSRDKKIVRTKPLSKTRNKLEEAHFFLQKIKDGNTKGPDLNYYLSAFINAARSVLWIMRAEYQEVVGWKDWYDSKEPSSPEKKILKLMTVIRNRSVKEKPLRLYASLTMIIPKESLTEELKDWIRKQNRNRQPLMVKLVPNQTTETFAGSDHVTANVKVNKVFMCLDDFPSKDIISVCVKYYKLLEKMIKECESRFEAPVSKLTRREELEAMFETIMANEPNR
jgi:hypothetical protein